MIASWMLYTIAISALLAGATLGLERIARLRRWPARGIWLAAVCASLVVPIVADLFAHPGTAQIGAGASSALPSRFSLDMPLLVLWGVASLVMAIRLVAAMVTLRRRRQSWRSTVVDGTPVLLTAEIGPALVGLIHPRPVIPAWALNLDATARALMLLHEAEHASASDPWLSAIGVMSLIATPWNPVLWWSVRRLRLAVEMDCDARVLRAGADPRCYATLLLAVGERISRTPFAWATALAEPQSLLEQRILAMTSPSRSRRPLLAVAGLGGATAIALLAACEAPIPDPVHAGPAASTVAATPEKHLGDTVTTTIMVNGVPMTRMNVIYRIKSASGGEHAETSEERRDQTIDNDKGTLSADRSYVYYTKDSLVPGRDRRPEQP